MNCIAIEIEGVELKVLIVRQTKLSAAMLEVSEVELARSNEFARLPLDAVPSSLFPERQKLLDSWQALSSVRKWDANTLFHILKVLLETRPGRSGEAQTFEPPVVRSKPSTVRHPRRDQESSRPARCIDVRPYLCDPKTLRQMLALLEPHSAEAQDLLQNSGFDRDRLASVFRGRETDAYFAFHHGFCENPGRLKLPANFQSCVLPLLKGQLWKTVSGFLALHWSMNLENEDGMRAAVCRLLCLRADDTSLSWLQIAQTLPRRRRIPFVLLLIRSKAWKLDPGKYPAGTFGEMSRLCSNAVYRPRLLYFFLGLAKNRSIDFIFCGFRLANDAQEDHHFDRFHRCGFFPEKSVHRLIQRMEHSKEFRKPWAMWIWEICGQSEDFGKTLRSTRWRKFTPAICWELVNLMILVACSVPFQKHRHLWDLVHKHLGQWSALLQKRDEKFQKKFFRNLSILLRHSKSVRRHTQLLTAWTPLLERVCRPPFHPTLITYRVLAPFVNHTGNLFDAFITAPDSSFQNLEKATASNNDYDLIAEGVRALVKAAPLLSIKCFRHFGQRFFKTAKLLGALPITVRRETLIRAIQHPVFVSKFRRMPVEQAAAIILNAAGCGIANPVPRSLQKFLKGEITLTARRVNRYKRVMFENLNLTRLEILEKTALEALSRGQADDVNGPVTHALLAVRDAHENKRAFKRFLTRYLSGHTTYLEEHPGTRAWMSKHANLDLRLWTTGVPFEKMVEGFGRVGVELERNPLEALRLGTHAGSCLGLGGANVFSAAAVVLDVNKQVFYARNEKGQVIGRQLLALSEESKLVCFSVYPKGADPAIKQLFREFDILFAQSLQIARVRSVDNYTIAHILSHDWYDDYAWNFTD